MQHAHTYHHFGEHRLIAFGGLQEIPKPAITPEKPAEAAAPPPVGANRAYMRIEAMLKELADMEHLVDKDVADNFRAKIETIRAKLKALDLSHTEAILALEKQVYADCAPFLEKSFKIRLSGCRKILSPVLKNEKLDCEFGGEKMTLTLTPSHQVRAVSVMGASLPLRVPVDIERFDVAVGDNLLASLRLIAKRFDIKLLNFTANETRIEWTAEGKNFVASSVDILEVVQSPKPEVLAEYQKLMLDMDRLRERSRTLEKTFPSATLSILFKAFQNKAEPITDGLTEVQKRAWAELKILYKELNALSNRRNSISDAASLRILRAEDGTTVREEGDPEFTNYVKWTYLDAEGKSRRDVHWSAGEISTRNEYEKGQPVRTTYFAIGKNGLPSRAIDWQTSTEDSFDSKGRKSHRRIFDPKNREKTLQTVLFSTDGTLLDEATLQAMTPEQIETALMSQLSQQEKKPNNIVLTAVYSYAKYLAKCPRAKEILRVTMQADPTQAFVKFETYQAISCAIEVLEEAAYQLGDKASVVHLISANAAVAKLPEAQKKKLLDLSGRKAVYGATFTPRYQRRDHKPQSDKFLQDPALQHLQDVQAATRKWRHYVGEVPLSWLRRFKDEIDPAHMPSMSYAEGSDVEQQMMVMIARNLYFQNKAVTPETVMAETKRILDTRKRYADVPLFAGRNVLHVAHGEKIEDQVDFYSKKPLSDAYKREIEKKSGDPYRFGGRNLQEAIKKQQNGRGNYSFLRPEARGEALDTKTKTLQAIRTLAPPATFFFDGHGGPDAFYLTDGSSDFKDVSEKTVSISVREMADAFAERARNFPELKDEDPGKKDICIFYSCYSSTFVHAFYERLEGLPKPATIAAAEYGQFSYTNYSSPLLSTFAHDVLQLGKSEGVSTFADVFQRELSNDSNPSLYIPDASGRTMQFSRNDTPSEPSNG